MSSFFFVWDPDLIKFLSSNMEETTMEIRKRLLFIILRYSVIIEVGHLINQKDQRIRTNNQTQLASSMLSSTAPSSLE
jgi:hypothetical protein